jgi:Xaa-Pro aminopeptidase
MPGDFVTASGELLRIDFGVRQEEYTSDMQRTFYFLREGETAPPAAVAEPFAHIDAAIQLGASAIKPGVKGWEVDKVMRDYFAEHDLPVWNYAAGHQMGRACHDGGTLLGPRWERYGDLPDREIEAGQVFVLETGFSIPEFGWAVIEDDYVVTRDGIEWLASPQRELILIG